MPCHSRLLASYLLEYLSDYPKQVTQTKCMAQHLHLFKINKYGKYTLHLSRNSNYWMAGWVFRISRGRHHSYSACHCSYCHSNKAYTGKKRVKNQPQSKIEWSLPRPLNRQSVNLRRKGKVCTHFFQRLPCYKVQTRKKLFFVLDILCLKVYTQVVNYSTRFRISEIITFFRIWHNKSVFSTNPSLWQAILASYLA